MLIENYRGYDILRDEKGICYQRPGKSGLWYFPTLEDAKIDIDIWLDY